MDASHGKSANACLAELRQARGDKAAISFTGVGAVKEITRLHKKVNPLSYGKIRCLLKSMTQPLLVFFTFPCRQCWR
jgi:hypothetical protein